MGGRSKPVIVQAPDPIVTRMPSESDPALRAAQQRAVADARKKTGRTSTILSDSLRSLNGSAGRLGA
jgi:hypothetical protein